MTLEADIRRFLAEVTPLGAESATVATDHPLIDAGVIDSSAIFELVEMMEEHLGIEIGEDEIVPEHFESIEALVEFAQRKR